MSDGVILGTGIDLVENDRMDEVLQRWGGRFKDKVFLAEEQRYCESKAFPGRHYAGRFAVKEAVTKAFGTGIGPHLSWLDIEVVRDSESGAPSVSLNPRVCRLLPAHKDCRVLVSLSHTRTYAVAHAILIGTPARQGRP